MQIELKVGTAQTSVTYYLELLRNPVNMREHLYKKYDTLMSESTDKDAIRKAAEEIEAAGSVRILAGMLG